MRKRALTTSSANLTPSPTCWPAPIWFLPSSQKKIPKLYWCKPSGPRSAASHNNPLFSDRRSQACQIVRLDTLRTSVNDERGCCDVRFQISDDLDPGAGKPLPLN